MGATSIPDVCSSGFLGLILALVFRRRLSQTVRGGLFMSMRILAFIFSGVFALLWSPMAVLADDKVYHAAFCTSPFEPVTADIDGILNLSLPGPSNIATVNCPIVRDRISNTNGLRVVNVRLFIPDNSDPNAPFSDSNFAIITTRDVGCSIFSFEPFVFDVPSATFNTAGFARRLYREIYGTQQQLGAQRVLNFSRDAGTGLTDSSSQGPYILRCDVLPGQYIFSYTVGENAGAPD
jgi:hypothetical protein